MSLCFFLCYDAVMSSLKDFSLEKDYVHIKTDAGVSFGGSQMWFKKEKSRKDKRLHQGGCGLVASMDLLLYYCKKNGIAPAELRKVLEEEAPERNDYLDLLRKNATLFRYPVSSRFGSLSFEVTHFVNRFMRKHERKERLRHLFLNTKRRREKIFRHAAETGYPLILIIGQPFFRPFSKKGVDFYRQTDEGFTKQVSDIRRHFVTVTGVLTKDGEKWLEITSWGRKYYIREKDLTHYMKHVSAPWITSYYYLV